LLDKNESINNEYQFTGRQNDDNRLYYYRARYYDNISGRFISWSNDDKYQSQIRGIGNTVSRVHNGWSPNTPQKNEPAQTTMPQNPETSKRFIDKVSEFILHQAPAEIILPALKNKYFSQVKKIPKTI